MSWIKSLGRVVKSVIPVLVFHAPDTGYIKPTFIRFFRLQCKRGTTPKNEHGNSKMDLCKMKILFREVRVFRGCKSKNESLEVFRRPLEKNRPLEMLMKWILTKISWSLDPKRLWLFHGRLLWIPSMHVSKSPLDHQPKPTIRIRLPLWWNLAPIQVSWYFRFPESFFFRGGGGGGRGCADFFVDDQILPEGFTFFFFRNLLVREYHFLDITPMLQELKWCFWEMFLFAPYMTQQIKNVTNSSEIDFSKLLCVFFFFPRHLPPTKPLSTWWGETTKKTKHRRTLKLSCVTPPAVLLFPFAFVFVHLTHFEHR